MKKKIFATGVALVASLTMATGAFADTQTNNVDITVESGEFSLETPSVDSFGNIALKADPKTHATSFDGKFNVKDLRGTQEGYRLDVSASQFSNGVDQLPKGSLSLDPVSNVDRVGTGEGNAPTKSTNSNTVIDDGAVEVLKATAGNGMGVFDVTFPNDALKLTVDATTAKAGTYESTITWDLVQAP